MPKVIVVGSGPAGLAAAEALLDAGPADLEVQLCTMGHILGGKACSWQTEDGRTLEHGQHVVLGFYDQMRALVSRAGVDLDDTSVSGQGRFIVWEERDQQTHHLHLGPSSLGTLLDGLAYDGWSAAEKAGFAAFFARAMPEILARGVPESWDDQCLTAWALKRGMPPQLFETTLLRASRDAQLNWPGEISAYSMLRTVRAAGRDYSRAEARFPGGGMSALWWKPVAARIEALGGQVTRLQKLVGIQHQDGRLLGLEFASPLPHDPARPYIDRGVPILPGTLALSSADAAILTLPPPALAQVVARDPTLSAMPPLAWLGELTTVAPLGLHVWHKATPRPRHQTVVLGLPQPLGYVVDNKPNYPEYRDDERFGACLHFVGQETCFEEWDDQALLDRALTALQRVEGYEELDRAGVIDFAVVRNRGPHKRYWNAEPGSLAFKPKNQTPVQGLFLAGDWVRSNLDFPCMENAVRPGRQAAELLLRSLRRSTRQRSRPKRAGSGAVAMAGR
ncbi:MAG: FAD-dependent oxidoreductase [Oligoflexia bacterium]|nr:FAD-dependent oxidoreductase [Oligoflexia bacterium]